MSELVTVRSLSAGWVVFLPSWERTTVKRLLTSVRKSMSLMKTSLVNCLMIHWIFWRSCLSRTHREFFCCTVAASIQVTLECAGCVCQEENDCPWMQETSLDGGMCRLSCQGSPLFSMQWPVMHTYPRRMLRRDQPRKSTPEDWGASMPERSWRCGSLLREFEVSFKI